MRKRASRGWIAGALVVVSAVMLGGPGSAVADQETTTLDGKLLFIADVQGAETLYSTDGSGSGTKRVKEVGNSTPTFLRLSSKKALFVGYDSDHGEELWTTNGKASGTKLVKDIAPGNVSSDPRSLVKLGSKVLFEADDGSHGSELWISNGTKTGTKLVKDILPGTGGGASGGDRRLVAFGKTAYLSADDGSHGFELWRSDGTKSGTKLVKDVNSGGGSYPYDFVKLGKQVLFAADDATHGAALYKTDGSSGGTKFVHDIGNTTILLPSGILGNQLLFSSNERLWRTDSTPGGTSQVGEVAVQRPGFARLGSYLYFAGNNPENGEEVWRSNGKASQTKRIKDLNSGPADAYPFGFAKLGSKLIFNATVQGDAELYGTDGSSGGTKLIKDIDPTGSAYPRCFYTVHGKLLFEAEDGSHGQELFTTNGSGSGTKLVKDLYPGPSSSYPFSCN